MEVSVCFVTVATPVDAAGVIMAYLM